MKASKRRFEQGEYLARQAKTRAAMEAAEVELLIVYDPANMCWLTGYDGWSFYVHQCVVIGTDGTLFWYGRGIDAKGAELTTDLSLDNILAYPDEYVMTPERHPMEHLAGILQEKSLDKCAIGLEKDNYYFSARAAESLYSSLPHAQFSDQTSLVNWQRAVKSATEIIYMQRAGKVIEGVYERIMQVAHVGMRKNDLVAEIMHAGAQGKDGHYGDYPSLVPLIGAGEEAAACHMTWDDQTLAPEEGMFLELAGAHNRYHCPCSRTLFLGTPTQKYRDIEKVINECIESALEKFKPGIACAEIAEDFSATLKRHGYEKENRVGYPIGLSYPPDWGERTMSLRANDSTLLEENMTFHFMPAIWFDDWGFEMTESVRVTPKGGECLSNVPRQLLVK
ncbi:MAG: M24 family metallopeptidase [Gammaproteobacteria bacterium]|nr:M24 family metallopeptidase [Gammaproteobacteria bacterium]